MKIPNLAAMSSQFYYIREKTHRVVFLHARAARHITMPRVSLRLGHTRGETTHRVVS